jgi:Flp pilus assembly protein TadD
LTTPDGRAGQIEIVALLVLLVVAYSTSIVLFVVSGRYRAPLIPFLMLGAAYALEKVYGFVKDGNWRDVRGLAIVFVVFYLPANYHIGGFGEQPSAFHLHRGIAYERDGNVNAAVADYEAALRLNKNDPLAHCRLGEVLRRRGDFEQASAHFSEAVRIDPTLADAHVGLGKLYGRAGRFNDAMAEFNTAIGISPVNWEAHAGLGATCGMMGDRTGAEREFLDALAQNPKATEVMLCLAQLSLDAGRKAEAMRYVERALAVDRKNEAVLLFKRRLEERE